MAYTEFYCVPTGSNLNAGSSTADAAAFTYTSAVSVSAWNSATGVFTVASGTPNSDMASMADGTHWASVYVTAGALVTAFVGRITGVSSTTITVSLTFKSGTAPATDSLGATTLKVDGAWKGPNGLSWFPFAFAGGGMTNAAVDYPRVNFKAGSDYALAAGTPLTSVIGTAATDLLTTVGTAPATGTLFFISFASGFGGLLTYNASVGGVAQGQYWAINISSTTFKAATTYANAIAGTAIDITSDGTGATVTPMPGGPTIPSSPAGPVIWEGYTTNPGDATLASTYANITGDSSTLPFPGLTSNCARHEFRYLQLNRNGLDSPGPNAHGNYMLQTTSGGTSNVFYRLRFTNTWRDGLRIGGAANIAIECEGFNCNVDSANGYAQFNAANSTVFVRCWSHHSIKVGDAGDPGFIFQAATALRVVFDSCISSHNNGAGFLNATGAAVVFFRNCVAAYNGLSGIEFATGLAGTSSAFIENCIFVGNGTGDAAEGGVRYRSSTWGALAINNAFFGNGLSGTNQYMLGITSLNIGTITLTGDPFVNGAAGNFALNNTSGAGAACRGLGAVSFPNTGGTYTLSTLGYPDVGPVQHQEAAAGQHSFVN